MARRSLLDRDFDLIIINTPLPMNSAEILRLTWHQTATPECFFSRTPTYMTSYRRKQKNSASLSCPNPTTKSKSSGRYLFFPPRSPELKVRGKTTEFRRQNQRNPRVINHAKWLIIEHEAMNETQAHKYIEKQAMDRRLTRLRVAEEIIDTYEGSGK